LKEGTCLAQSATEGRRHDDSDSAVIVVLDKHMAAASCARQLPPMTLANLDTPGYGVVDHVPIMHEPRSMTRSRVSASGVATIVAVTGATAGIGKTCLTVNLAASLARLGYHTGILDTDFGPGNVDMMLGLTPALPVGVVLAGEQPIADVRIDGPDGIHVISAGTGVRALTNLTDAQWQRLRHAIVDAAQDLDVLLIDTATPLSARVIELARLADHVLVVTLVAPRAMVDAYAMLKLLHRSSTRASVGVVVNSTRDDTEGLLVHRRLRLPIARFLNQTLHYYGSIAKDARVREAVLRQRPVVSRNPDSAASRGYRLLALRVANLLPLVQAWAPAGSSTTNPLTDREFHDLEAPRCA
jgi:flagellar biosynthesis protein FlhG